MTSTHSQPILATPVSFEWWRADNAEWVDRSGVEARLTLAEFARRSAPVDDEEWAELRGEAEELGHADPWLIASWGARYEPLSELPALFREFAAMPPDRTAYLAFAEAYGPLTARPDGGFPGRLSLWGREHQELRYAVSLFDALSSGITDDLGALGIVGKAAGDDSTDRRRFEASPSRADNWNQTVESLFECSRLKCDVQMLRILRDRMSGDSACAYGKADTSPRTIVRQILASLLTEAFGRHGVSVVFTADEVPLGSGVEPSFKVRDLIGALWVQLALAVAGNRTYRSCPVCGKWWDATNARSHKTVCSDNCRAKRSYRQRKAAEEQTPQTDEPS